MNVQDVDDIKARLDYLEAAMQGLPIGHGHDIALTTTFALGGAR
jgi:hypothetical protein